MRAVLSERLPGHGILGEEFGHDRPDTRLQWVLDPIDGTKAFITGRPIFGTLIALLDDGVPVLGVIDQPITHERWIGVAGQATQFRGLHGRAGARACPSLGAAELSCTSPSVFGAGDQAKWDRLAPSVGRITWGGDCYSYGLLALGLVDIVVDSTMKIWDWAALVPVIEGAGGCVTDWAGRTLRADGDGRVLAVGDPALLPHVTALLSEDPSHV